MLSDPNIKALAAFIHRGRVGERLIIVQDNKPFNAQIIPHPNGCKKIVVGSQSLMEQNKEKSSKWAIGARNGHRVTWLWTNGNYDKLIIDNQIFTSW